MAEQFVGKWKLVDSDNFDEYMKEVGVGFLKRKMAETSCFGIAKLHIRSEGTHWKMVSESTFTTWTCEFDLGKEIEQDTPDGRKMKSTFTFENGKLIEEQKKINADDKDSHFERYIDSDGQLVIECLTGLVNSTLVYQMSERVHSCKICPYTTKKHSNLIRHIKTHRSKDLFSSVPEEFGAAAAKVKTLKTSPSNDELLQLYALYKQGTCGDNDTCKPGTFDFKGKKKWEAWNGKKGVSMEEAQAQYVKLVNKMVEKYGVC